MHSREHDIVLRRTAHNCFRMLGLHRSWKLGKVKWDTLDVLDKENEAQSFITQHTRTIDVTVDVHVTAKELPWTLFHEFYHLITLPIEYLVRENVADETLKTLHRQLTENAIEELVEVTRWMLKERDRLQKQIAKLQQERGL